MNGGGGDVSNVNRMRNRCGGPRRRVKRGNNVSEHRDVQGCVEKTVCYVKSFISRNENNIKSDRVTRACVVHRAFRITVPTAQTLFHAFILSVSTIVPS